MCFQIFFDHHEVVLFFLVFEGDSIQTCVIYIDSDVSMFKTLKMMHLSAFFLVKFGRSMLVLKVNQHKK